MVKTTESNERGCQLIAVFRLAQTIATKDWLLNETRKLKCARLLYTYSLACIFWHLQLHVCCVKMCCVYAINTVYALVRNEEEERDYHMLCLVVSLFRSFAHDEHVTVSHCLNSFNVFDGITISHSLSLSTLYTGRFTSHLLVYILINRSMALYALLSSPNWFISISIGIFGSSTR